MIEQLLLIRWLEWADRAVSEITPLLCSEMIDEFVRSHKVPSDRQC